MIGTKCPGQDMRYWTAEDVYDIKCPHCGNMIEFFKTDIRLRCPSCRERVANPKFSMGCAEYCAYAEQCLGPGARGLKSKSLKALLEEALEKEARDKHYIYEEIKLLIDEAEVICDTVKVDMFPVIAALVALRLKASGLIENETAFIDELTVEQTLPQGAVKDTLALIENIKTGQKEGPMEDILRKLLEKID